MNASSAHLTWIDGASGSAETQFFAEGMHCANCARSIRKTVGALPGVRHVEVNLATARVSVGWDPAAQRATSPYEIFDCRLVLALDDFAVILGKYDVQEVVHFSVYRPPIKTWPADKPGKQHTGGLAIDAGQFIRKDGTVLQVERDFHGAIGAPTCGGTSGPSPATADATALRGILCEAATAHLFNVVLTPDFNWAHRNHFHLEVTVGAKWFLVK